jgi:pimeloyl-ACP methyl ester carboxylesterase
MDEATHALFMMNKLGYKVVVIGTSMGGAIATYLASQYPEKIQGVVLASPFYDFSSLPAELLYYRPLFKCISLISPVRQVDLAVPPEKDNWTDYWYRFQYWSSLDMVMDIAKITAQRSVYEKISEPVLLLYYCKDEKHQDDVASVSAMKDAFSLFGKGSSPNPLNKEIAIKEGNHVLLSRYFRKDVDLDSSVKEMTSFLMKIETNW